MTHWQNLDDLTLWERNYNHGDVPKIKASIRRYGFNNALRLWQGKVMAGNHSTLALRELKAEGWDKPRGGALKVKGDVWQVDTVALDHLSEIEAEAFAVADNHVASLATPDEIKLAEVLERVKHEAPDALNATGFDEAALGELLARLGGEAVEDPGPQVDRAAELNQKWQCERGQLWIIPSKSGKGEHRLLCGDSTNADDVARVMGGEKADICFTSPPYNAGGNNILNNKTLGSKKYGDKSKDKLDTDSYYLFISAFTEIALSNCQYCIVNIQPLQDNKIALINYLHAFQKHFVDIAVWVKTNPQPAMAENVMNSAFEFLLIFSSDNNPNRAIRTGRFRGTVSNVFLSPSNGGNVFSEVHAATFPIKFPVWGLDSFSQVNSCVYEPFTGSGTTLVACEQLGRQGRGIEIEPKYCAVTLERLSQMGLEPRLSETELTHA